MIDADLLQPMPEVVQEKLPAYAQIEADTFKKYEEDTARLVKSNFSKLNPSSRNPVDDVAWDCFETFLKRNFFVKFDHSKSNYWNYLKRGVSNFLIDKERSDSLRVTSGYDSEGSPVKVTLTSTTDEETGGDKLASANIRQEQRDLFQNMMQTVGLLKDTRLDTYADVTGYEVLFGEISLNHYNVARLYLLGYTYERIGSIFGEPAELIGELFIEAVDILRQKAECGEISLDEMLESDLLSEEESYPVQGTKDLELDFCTCGEDEYREVGKRVTDICTGRSIVVKKCIECGKTRTELDGTPAMIYQSRESIEMFIKVAFRVIKCSGEKPPLHDLTEDHLLRNKMRREAMSYFKGNNMGMSQVMRWAYLFAIDL